MIMTHLIDGYPRLPEVLEEGLQGKSQILCFLALHQPTSNHKTQLVLQTAGRPARSIQVPHTAVHHAWVQYLLLPLLQHNRNWDVNVKILLPPTLKLSENTSCTCAHYTPMNAKPPSPQYQDCMRPRPS